MIKCFICTRKGCKLSPYSPFCAFKLAPWAKYVKNGELAVVGVGGLSRLRLQEPSWHKKKREKEKLRLK